MEDGLTVASLRAAAKRAGPPRVSLRPGDWAHAGAARPLLLHTPPRGPRRAVRRLSPVVPPPRSARSHPGSTRRARRTRPSRAARPHPHGPRAHGSTTVRCLVSPAHVRVVVRSTAGRALVQPGIDGGSCDRCRHRPRPSRRWSHTRAAARGRASQAEMTGMRIMFVAQDFPPHVGGIQTYAVRVAEQLAAHCQQFSVIAPRSPGWEAVDARLGFEVIRIGRRHDWLPLRSIPTLVRLVHRRGFEAAFHTQWQTTPLSAALRRAGWLRRLYVAAHGRELLTGPNRFRRAFDRLRAASLQQADAVFSVSANTGRLVRDVVGVDPHRIAVVPNGTDPGQWHRVDATAWRRQHDLGQARVVASVGRLVPNKGFDRVIEAMPTVLARVPNTIYIVGGTGPDEARLRELARSLGVASRVRFVGRVPDHELNAFYSGADVFTTISREAPPAIEGFGIVFLEAAACETPVVAGRSGGIPDAVLDGETGILVDPQRADAVAAGILQILEDPALGRRLGRHGRQRVVDELNWPQIGKRLAELIAADLE
ncbi:MAG: glycosyltransferase family 4 protein [Myxococcales bacterium FL481]|nr:MAG: glycosyltransferase family 4 protein [Myxococcales bacterium FL481]